MQKKRILLVGLKFWINLIPEKLQKFTFTKIEFKDWWSMSTQYRRKLIRLNHIIHHMWGRCKASDIVYARLNFKKVFIHYMGSDVIYAIKNKRKAWWCSKLANQTFCDSPNLQSELATIGIKGIVLPNPVPNLTFGFEPFPKVERILAYVNQINENFYQINDVEAIAEALPAWEFIVVGHNGNGRKPSANLKYYGHVNKKEITRLIKASKIYLRLTKHDATGKMALEAMAQGRYIIRNMDWPYTISVKDSREAIEQIKNLKYITTLNMGGYHYVTREWQDDITFGRFEKLYNSAKGPSRIFKMIFKE